MVAREVSEMTESAEAVSETRRELDQVRLDADLTYEQLAESITATAGSIDPASVYRFLNEPDRKPYDRTVHRIRKFLDERRATVSAKRGKRA
jgi:hypothetical protein